MTKRIDWIDIAKGIAIILVVIGHTLDEASIARHVIFSFHMPVFFILAGYTMRPKPMSTVVRSSWSRLLVPYLLICIAWWGASWLQDPAGFSGSILLKYLGMVVFASGYDNYALGIPAIGIAWFLVALFCARLLVNAGLLVNQKNGTALWKLAIVYLVLAIVGAVLGYYRIFLPLSLDVAFVASFLMWCGYMAKCGSLMDWIVQRKWVLIPIAVVWIGSLFTTDFEMAARHYGMFVMSMAGALCGTCLVCFISWLIDNYVAFLKKPLVWAGQNSMLVYNIHAVDWFVPWRTLPLLASLPASHFLGGIARCVCDFALAAAFRRA